MQDESDLTQTVKSRVRLADLMRRPAPLLPRIETNDTETILRDMRLTPALVEYTRARIAEREN
jgi:hypothetical protein